LPWRADDLMLTYDHRDARFAYPVGILNWHEIVNHAIDDKPVLITFCPLCGTGMAFNPVVDGRHYNPDVPSAELRDESGQLLPATRAFWFAWYTFYPDTGIFEAD
jgi:hypothetical protein